MRAFLSLAITLTALAACAQPGPKTILQGHRCDPIPPDSVDITGDGIADLVICGQAGVTTLDKSPRVGMCHVVVRTLPGTYLLSSVHPMGGRIIRGFVRGEPIPALDGVPVEPAEAGQGMRDLSRPSGIPRHAFIAGEVRAPGDSLVVLEELSELALPLDAEAWWAWADYDTQEQRFQYTPLREATWVNTPLTVRTREGIHLAVHEAALVDHPAMTLKQDARGVYRTDLVPWADGTRVKCVGALRTPWRVLLVGPDAAGLLTSDLLLNLNEPCRIADTAWIRPMTYMGIWWEMHLGTHTWTPGDRHGATTARAGLHRCRGRCRRGRGAASVVVAW